MREGELETLRQAIDLAELIGEDVELRRRGDDLWGSCPFHEERTPSFVVHPDRGFWHCFGCGESGDAFTWVMRTRGVSFFEATQALAERAGMPLTSSSSPRLSRARTHEVIEGCAQAFQGLLASDDEHAVDTRSKLLGWGIDADVVDAYPLGLIPQGQSLADILGESSVGTREARAAGIFGLMREIRGDALVAPAYDAHGHAITLVGTSLERRPRTSFARNALCTPKRFDGQQVEGVTPHTTDALFGLSDAREHIGREREAIVALSPLAALTLVHKGLSHTVATTGGGLSLRMARALWAAGTEQCTLLVPSDATGEAAVVASLAAYLPSGIESIRIARIPGRDSLKTLGGLDVDNLRALVQDAPDIIAETVAIACAGLDLTDAHQLLTATECSCRLLRLACHSAAEAGIIADECARLLHVLDERHLEDMLLRTSPRGAKNPGQGSHQRHLRLQSQVITLKEANITDTVPQPSHDTSRRRSVMPMGDTRYDRRLGREGDEGSPRPRREPTQGASRRRTVTERRRG